MTRFGLALVACILVGCSPQVGDDMIEIVAGETLHQKVYLQCVIHDEQRREQLLPECLERVRGVLNNPVLNASLSPEGQAARREYRELRAREEAVRDEAEWFGQTGLSDAVETNEENADRELLTGA